MTSPEKIGRAIDDCVETIAGLRGRLEQIDAICRVVVLALKTGAKVLTAGNGGSAAEAMHMAEELIGRFRCDRVSLPAVSLAADATVLTCIGNDYGFESIFSRQIEGLGQPGDVLVVFSTSGNSRNVLNALKAASSRGVISIALLGKTGGAAAGIADYEIVVPGNSTERIQEAHQLLLHIILEAVEAEFS